MIIQLKQGLRYAVCLSILVWSSCSNIASNPSEGTLKLPSDTLLGKILRLPKDIEVYTAYEDSLYMDNIQLVQRSPFRIYAFINVSCSSCISDIDKWTTTCPEFFKYKVPVVLVCFSDDNFEYVRYLFESNKLRKFPFPLYLDAKRLFYPLNNFIKEDVAHQAVLVDSSNTIVATGNPIVSEQIKNRYLQLINRN